MKFRNIIISFLLFNVFSVANAEQNQQFKLQDAFPNLSFNKPVDLQHAGDGTNRVFVASQSGFIYVFENTSSVNSAKIFLDIQNKVAVGGELGLLGFAFHPDYENNGYFYIYYMAPAPLRSIIARYSVSSTNPDAADNNSELILLQVDQPSSIHKGGQLAFGPDGYLYIALGDGNAGGDPLNNGQDKSSSLGKILRIDVNCTSQNKNYCIPPDNPFAGNTQGYKEEIYAYGFRNPWRFSFDPVTGWLWVADVGQDLWEEIDIVEKGGNYGWRIMEGNHCYNPLTNCDTSGLTFPLWEYGHDNQGGCSITGGYAYRGIKFPELYGKYIYGDFCRGRIWALSYDGVNPASNTLLLTENINISSFGVDKDNEIYICDLNGKIYKLSTMVSVSHWKFDEGSGETATDSSGNGNDGAISGAAWTAGKSGSGLGFDGVNDYVSVPQMNNNEISICAWFNKTANDTTRNDAIFSGFRNNSNLQLREGFELRFPSSASNTLEFVLVTQDGSGIKTARTARRNLRNSVGSWYHAVGTYNQTTGQQRLYVNGELVNTATHPAGNTVVPMTFYSDMRIGHSRVNVGYFNGVIDDVRLCSLPLTDQEIRTLYTAFTGDLQAHYTLDEVSGTIANDTSGNGNHGGVTGGAAWTTGQSGGGLSFDGVNDYVTLPRINNDEVSVCVWFYKNANDTTRNDAILGGFRNNSNVQLREGYELRFPSGNPDTLQFVLVTQDGSGVKTMRTAQSNFGNSVGSWYHAVGTYNKATGEQKLYINGQLVNTQTHAAGNTVVPLTFYSDMRMGHSRVNAGYFNGILDDVRIYKQALNDQEALDIYNGL